MRANTSQCGPFGPSDAYHKVEAWAPDFPESNVATPDASGRYAFGRDACRDESKQSLCRFVLNHGRRDSGRSL